jgi:tetratricopeptide (TPR) repeat protein
MTTVNIIAIILIVVCLVLIIRMITKKLPILAVMDVQSIPGQKEAKFKEQIVRERLERNLIKRSFFLVNFLKGVFNRLDRFWQGIDKSLSSIKKKYQMEKKKEDLHPKNRLAKLLKEAQSLFDNEKLPEAENLLMEIISTDDQCLEAFVLLGELYSFDKKYKEAKETLNYAQKLSQRQGKSNDLAEISFDLAKIDYALENWSEAIEMVRQSLDLVPNNPRYLDILLDSAIMKKDKILALETLEKLFLANPENQKIAGFKERINNL